MSTPNFFANLDAINCLLKIDIPETSKDVDLTLDVIDLPYWFSFRSNKKTSTLKVYTQMDLYMKDETMAAECGSLVLDKESGDAAVTAPQTIGQNMGAFCIACQKISLLVQEKGLETLYAGLNPENAGILLTANNGKLSWKVVSGKERPELMVQTLFGGMTMCRPYMDDFLERSELEEFSLGEKIESAENGNTAAMEQLAMLYLNGDEENGIEPDPEKGVYWFGKLAETGDASAMFNLGLHYAKGHGVKRDFAKAAKWMEKAARAGDSDAPALVEEYKKLADASDKAKKGDTQAQAVLAKGLMTLAGCLEQAGAGNDYTECVKWAKLSAEHGNAEAMWVLALAYEHGRGVGKDINTAVKYYEEGAELGNAACQHSLGCYYARGDYLKKDDKKAFELFKQSAVQGYGLAMKDLGRCYQFGTGCMGNMKTALEWYKEASKILDDPELDQRVMAFESLSSVDPNWGEDYPSEDCTDDFGEEFPKEATTRIHESYSTRKATTRNSSSQSAILALSSFEVTDDMDSLRSFIKNFTHNWFSALKESNEVIENERPTPICRYNDSRIKKLETNSENVISDYAGKLQDVMVKLDQLGDKKIAEKAPEKEIKEICNLISECFDDLHMETTVTIYKNNKKFAHKIKKVYVDLSEKWGNIYSSLPSTKIKAMNKELKEKERKLEEIKKNVSSEKRRRTILGKNIEKAEKDVESAQKAYDDEAKVLENRKTEYDSCVALLNSEVSDISDEIQQLEKDFSGVEEKKAASAKEFSEKISSNEKELNKLNEKLRTLKNEREIISGEEKLKREKAESAILFKKKKQQEYDEVSGRLAEKDKVVSECEKEKSDLDAQISQLKGEMKESNAKYEDRISQMRQKIRDLVASRAEKEYDIESLGKEMADYEKNLSRKEADLRKAEYELAWQKREYDIADKKVTDGEKKKETAESAVSKLDKKITKAKTSDK